MGKLDGKIALITGGTTGIGAATARLFQAEGARVFATGLNPKTVEAAQAELPGVTFMKSDQGDTQAIRSLMDAIRQKAGRIDILFVNAGVGFPALLDGVDEALFDKLMNINVRGPFFTVKHAVPLIPEGGAIILNASEAASTAAVGLSVYGATKAAIRSLARSFAAELAPRNIRVNAISPGPTATPIFGKSGMPEDVLEGFFKEKMTHMAIKRVARPEEIAAAVLFLAADATFTTGSELMASGGLGDL